MQKYSVWVNLQRARRMHCIESHSLLREHASLSAGETPVAPKIYERIIILSSSLKKQIDDNFDQSNYTLGLDNGFLKSVKVQPALEIVNLSNGNSKLLHRLTVSVLNLHQ